jgi:hypothetical protein
MDSLGLGVLRVLGNFLFFLLLESLVYCWIFLFVGKSGLTMDADTDIGHGHRIPPRTPGMDIDMDNLYGHGNGQRAWAWTWTPGMGMDIDTVRGHGYRTWRWTPGIGVAPGMHGHWAWTWIPGMGMDTGHGCCHQAWTWTPGMDMNPSMDIDMDTTIFPSVIKNKSLTVLLRD